LNSLSILKIFKIIFFFTFRMWRNSISRGFERRIWKKIHFFGILHFHCLFSERICSLKFHPPFSFF